MINRIIKYSINNKIIILLMVMLLIGAGVYSLVTINLDSTPDITNNQVQVITVSQNLSTEDIEQLVTYPVELAMSNLPGVTEIRSISRFGLSVVTIVFKDKMGTFLPRQVVQEKLNDIKEQIPEQFGTPTLGPITTGLGEIFQYTIRPINQNDTRYSPTELRSIQDWIVKRQLSLIPGVIDVNSFGGNIKQYEIALNPDRLKAMNVTITDVYEALKNNNVNTGGAYIEKNHIANFIRGEGLIKSLDDIRNIVVKNGNGIPVLINDVAENVGYGSQIRYGAFTQDGKEAVGGMILMLKGENSNVVIKRVKARILEIQNTLPDGLEIVPFLDRSNLIHRTTGTISRNLVEGALIVIFVLVMLLGSLRGGLITASVIPLSLLFAFIMMKIFNVWANLMSLGAIDFGIIVDGAVIIVEGTVFEIERRLKCNEHNFSQLTMNEICYSASTTMMHSAFFGQLIILIVFTPIMFLTGVEGKMFQPMAYTFSFAVIGAILLCLTYVPMISSLSLKPLIGNNNWFRRLENKLEILSNELMDKIFSAYKPLLVFSLRRKKIVLIISLLFFAGTAFIFSRMGGVFIPSLDEGDIAMQTFLLPGSSLSETIKREEEVERVIKANFPEVKTVCARIGVADIPTDPMGFDYTDSFIILERDKRKWVSASTKDELIEKIKAKLSELPGLNFSFSQPVELRFNELLTGVREDIAVKLYGDDLDVLSKKGDEIADVISKIHGAGDVNVEHTSGLPQMTVKYDRAKIAQYGLDISKINQYISAAFAGYSAGVIFEGEKRYDMIIRFDEQHRKSIENLKNMYVDISNGEQIPIEEVADISYQPGPMQISRDNTFRRICIGVNARGKDIESLVSEIKHEINSQVKLPAGYHITYGGEFESLQRAKNRLIIVLPVALILIFILLFFALHSFNQTIMIFMAVPFSMIGGILALWIRKMPFSISAGVGFIVLFGVAVLNGLVLVNRFNSLQSEGINDLRERIFTATHERLRPILLTATAAMLGFLPMAVSASAGAEVQRPLATVVIGGLFTSTLLTLLIVPILYSIEEKFSNRRKNRNQSVSSSVIAVLVMILVQTLLPNRLNAQNNDNLPSISLENAVKRAKNNYPLIKIAQMRVKSQQALKNTAWEIGNTELANGGEEINKNNDGIYTLFSLRQDLDVLQIKSKLNVQKKMTDISIAELNLTEREVEQEVSIAYGNVYTAIRQYILFSQIDSVYSVFEKAAKLRCESKATSKLEYLSALNQSKQAEIQKEKYKMDYNIAVLELNLWLNSDTVFTIENDVNMENLFPLPNNMDSVLYNHPLLQLSEQRIKLADATYNLQKLSCLPKFYVEYGNQKIDSKTGYYSYQVGLSIPLFFLSESAKIKSAKIDSDIVREKYSLKQIEMNTEYKTLLAEFHKWDETCKYYRNVALPIAEKQRLGAISAYKEGEIDYVSFLQNIKDAMQVELDYWNSFSQYISTGFRVKFFNK